MNKWLGAVVVAAACAVGCDAGDNAAGFGKSSAAVPSTGPAGDPQAQFDTKENAEQLRESLDLLRNMLDLYSVEHEGRFPTLANFAEQATRYTSAAGATSAGKDADHPLGPYIRRVPALPVGGPSEQGKSTVGAPDAAVGSGAAWLYDEAKGTIRPNTGARTDFAGKRYADY